MMPITGITRTGSVEMHGDRRAPSDRHHAVPEYLGAYGARHPPVHFPVIYSYMYYRKGQSR